MGNRGKKEKARQGTCMKDTWTKKMGGVAGVGGNGGRKWRQLYLNNNKKRENKIK